MAAVIQKKLLTASDLATLCEVDLKTIHNWVDRGRISHFRTPGRHLRFRAADVADFLRTWGYAVPRALRGSSQRTYLVVGPAETLALVHRVLNIEPSSDPAIPKATPSGPQLAKPNEDPATPPPRHFDEPYDALVAAGTDPADVYIIDISFLVEQKINSNRFLEALHRASPAATFVALVTNDTTALPPPFTSPINRENERALKKILMPDAPDQDAEAENRMAEGG